MLPKVNDDKYIQIAHMIIAQVPQNQIAEAMGYADESRISQILQEPTYQAIENKLRLEKIEQTRAFNDSWDGAEAKALNLVHEYLETGADAEYALKVAVMANKAQKRGRNAGAIPGQNGMRAAIGLPTHVVQNLQQNNFQLNIEKTEDKDGENVDDKPQQRINSVLPTQVEKILSKAVQPKEGIFSDINIPEIAVAS